MSNQNSGQGQAKPAPQTPPIQDPLANVVLRAGEVRRLLGGSAPPAGSGFASPDIRPPAYHAEAAMTQRSNAARPSPRRMTPMIALAIVAVCLLLAWRFLR